MYPNNTLFNRNVEFENLWNSIIETEGVVTFDTSLFPSFLLVDNIYIKTEKRRNGLGTKIVNLLASFADKYGLNILLLPDESLGTPLEILTKFYEKFDFITQGEEGIEYGGGYESYLLRKPKK